jgi:putative transposase
MSLLLIGSSHVQLDALYAVSLQNFRFFPQPASGGFELGQGRVAVGDPKKRMELAVLKAAVGQVREEYAFSQRRACGLMTLAVSSYRYESRRSDDGLRDRLVQLAREKPRFGYRRLHVLLRRSGEAVNHKRVHRVYGKRG